jgi:3-oxoacyl-(acyl-carrier-protein) synthase
MEETEIVVTGFGIVCSLGDNPESVWLNLLNGLNGVRSIGSCHKELAGYGVHVLAPAVEVCVDNEIEDKKNGSKHEQGIENACLCRNAGIKKRRDRSAY